MSLVEIGDNLVFAENHKNAKAIAFAFFRFSAGKKLCSKVTGVVRGDSNVPPDHPQRHGSAEKEEKRKKKSGGI